MRTASPFSPGILLIEVYSFAATLLVLDRVEKMAKVQVLQVELNDNYGTLMKMTGDSASLRCAEQAARELADSLQVLLVSQVLDAPDKRAALVVESAPEFQPLLGQDVVMFPSPMRDEKAPIGALGLIETQGFTAVTVATDAACKAASVTVIAKEKLGGGYITIIVEGDVAAVTAAIEAGKEAVQRLGGKLISAHVIPRPSDGVRRILTCF